MVIASILNACFGENYAVLMQQLFTNWSFYPAPFLPCYTAAFLTFCTAVTLIIFIRITRFRIVHHFLEIILPTCRSLCLPLDDLWTSENLSTETSRYPWRPWVW